MFSSLKVRTFRIYWLGMFVSLIGSWIQNVAQSWLVFQLSGSAFLLGIVGFLSAFPVFLLTLFGGVIADRLNKRDILIITQSIFMVLAFVLALLTQFKIITVYQIMAIAFLNGVVMAFDGPSRQAMVVEMVGKPVLMNAIALNSAAFNSARIIGPALAAVLVSAIGMSGCFYVNGISFLAVIVALASIRIANPSPKGSQEKILKDLVEGLRFIKHNNTILLLVCFVGISSLFGISYIVLMPIFAHEVFGAGVQGLGMLLSCSGAGALAAALLLARLGDYKKKGMLLVISTLVFSLALMVFALSYSLAVSMVALVFVGWSSVTAISLVNTLLQALVPDRMRGRVMSVFMFTFAGVLPFGNLIAGALAQAWGVSIAVFAGALVCLIFFAYTGVRYPQIRRL